MTTFRSLEALADARLIDPSQALAKVAAGATR